MSIEHRQRGGVPLHRQVPEPPEPDQATGTVRMRAGRIIATTLQLHGVILGSLAVQDMTEAILDDLAEVGLLAPEVSE